MLAEPGGIHAPAYSLDHLNLYDSLNIVLVDPTPKQNVELKKQLMATEHVAMVGARKTPHYLVDLITSNHIDLIIYDAAVGWENILDSVRELRNHHNARNLGFMLIAPSIGQDNLRNFAEAGMLGFLQRPYHDDMLQQAIRAALGDVDLDLAPVINEMRATAFFRSFSDRDLLRLLHICENHYRKPGSVIFHEGDPGESLFILLSGRVQITLEIEGKTKVLTEITPGMAFGEMAIIDQSPRSANAIAAEPCTLFEVPRRVLTDDESDLALKLSRQIGIEMANKIRGFNYR